MARAELRLWIPCFQAHLPEHAAYAFFVDEMSSLPQRLRHVADSVKRRTRILLIKGPQQQQVQLTVPLRLG